MKKNIITNVQFFLEDIELTITVKKDFTKYEKEEPLKNFGYIQITHGSINDKPIFWDGLNFFLECNKKEFEEECGEDLKRKGYDWKETYKIIKTLLKRAKKLNIL
tara:strand:+ start:4053 stop:4367 length:315 start_codon:yes stop_codon:yes gene_type:complete